MNQAERYAGMTQLILVGYAAISAAAVIAATVLLPPLVSANWQWLAYILCFLFSCGLAITGWGSITTQRFEGYLARLLPGYAGVRFPVYHLLSHSGPGFDRAFPSDGTLYSLAEAEGGFVVLSNPREHPPHELRAGALVSGNRRPYLSLPRHRIAAVEVIERTDAQIAEAAVDPRDFAERLASMAVQRALGTKMKTRITPYAAYVIVTLAEDDGPAQLLFAIPTTVSAEVLQLMGDAAARDEQGNWLVEAAVDKAKDSAQDYAVEQGDALATVVVGAAPVELLHQGLGAIGEAQAWLDPDAAQVATTAGDRGRQMARMIGARLRRHAGLDAGD